MNTNEIPMFLMCVGATFYTRDSFKREAGRLGISRRMATVPSDLVLGRSKVLCAFEATKDSNKKRCECGFPVARWTLADGTVQPRCVATDCQKVHPLRKHHHAKVWCYFIPDRIELVLRVDGSAEAARNSILLSKELGVFEANVIDTPESLKAELTFEPGATSTQITEALTKLPGVTLDANLIARAVKAGHGITLVSREPQRGCGFRHHGGTYMVGSVMAEEDDGFALIEIMPPIRYAGQHFRGLKRLDSETAAKCERHIDNPPALESLAAVIPEWEAKAEEPSLFNEAAA